jgi:phosphoribosyl 1,2-cyclic phosphodiesterase
MRVTVLSSGSGGNCTLIEGAGLRVLVDAGLPLRAVKARLVAAGVPLSKGPISDLLITHEHSDHGGNAGVLGRKLGLTVRGTEGTLRALRDPPPEELWRFLQAGVPLRLGVPEEQAGEGLPGGPESSEPQEAPAAPPAVATTPVTPAVATAPAGSTVMEALFRTSAPAAAGGRGEPGPSAAPAPLRVRSNVVPLRPTPRGAELWVTPIALPHDAAAPVAYRFEERTAQGSVHAAIITDLGHVPQSVVAALQGLDLLVIEFNHDVQMLVDGPYPWALKQRIRGGRGHLSNVQAAGLLKQACHPGLREVVLAHLSEHNNTPRLAREAAEAVLARAGSGARLQIGSVQGTLAPIEVEAAAPVVTRGRWKPAQLALL